MSEHDIIIGGMALPDQNDGLGSGILSQPQPIDSMDDGIRIGQAQVSEPGIGASAEGLSTFEPEVQLETVGELQTKNGTNIAIVIAIATVILTGISLLIRFASKSNG